MLRRSGAGYSGFPTAIDVGGGNSILYGLSDFWALMFEDTELVDRMLEQYSIQMADVYNQFLQLTSTISLQDVQTFTQSEIKLLTLREIGSKVPGTQSTYKLPANWVSFTYLLTRPILPTFTFEDKVHYDIDVDNGTITFFEDLSRDTTPSRPILDPDTGLEVDREFALWATDVVFDSQLMHRFYGSMVGFDAPKPSAADQYSNFIRGLFFLYRNGPVVRYLEQGLSLSLGIPVARENEEILQILQDPDSGEHIVVTKSTSYRVPIRTLPDISVGDTLTRGTPLVQVAKVSDYISDPLWWENLAIPFALVDQVNGTQYGPSKFYNETPAGAITTPIVADNSGGPLQKEMYFLMDNYLKYHTFLVKLTWQVWSSEVDVETQSDLLRLLATAKPEYTFAIQLWEIAIDDDTMVVYDDSFYLDIDLNFSEAILSDMEFLDRSTNIGEWVFASSYSVGDVVVPPYEIYPNAMNIQAICVVAGVTSTTGINWDTVSVGDVVTDGSCTWSIQAKAGAPNAERPYAVFIRSNLDPDTIEEETVGVSFSVTADNHWPDRSTPITVVDSELIPLFNATAQETRDKLGFIGAFPGICMPDKMVISNVDASTKYATQVSVPFRGTYTESAFIRSYDEYVSSYGEGYSGLGYNQSPLPLPVPSQESYRAHFPKRSQLGMERIFVVKAMDDLYSWFLCRSTPLDSFSEGYFPVTDISKVTSYEVLDTESLVTPFMSNPGLTYSNNFTTITAPGA